MQLFSSSITSQLDSFITAFKRNFMIYISLSAGHMFYTSFTFLLQTFKVKLVFIRFFLG